MRAFLVLAVSLGSAVRVGAASPGAAAQGGRGSVELTLVRAGTPTATIFLERYPTKSAQFAAYELQWHVRQISGAELPIRRGFVPLPRGNVAIHIGDTARARKLGLSQEQFAPQEYAVVFRPGEIILVGRDADDRGEVIYNMADLTACANWPGFWEERGSLHATYDFLERFCGVHWFQPNEYGMVLPKTETLVVRGQDLRRRPHFEFRDAIGAWGDNPERYDAYTALWQESTDGYKAWEAAAYPKLRQTYPEPWRYAQAKRAHSMLFLLRMKNGGTPVRCNHSLYGYYDRFWNESSSLFVERRPEMFAQGYEGTPPQMCYTSRALIEQLAQDARDYYDGRKTGADLGIFWRPTLPNPFPVEPMDNASFCKCPECQKWLQEPTGNDVRFFSNGLHSDYFFNFVNEVQRELARTHPDKGLVTLAYMTHAAPPTRLKLDPRVDVQFCFACNRSPGGREAYEHELRLLKAWADEARQSGRRLYLWLYYTFPVEFANNGKYHCFPGFFAHVIGQQFDLFRRYGYRGMFHCGYGQEVEAYVTFKLMDDPTKNVDELLADYFNALYGAAGPAMRRLYEEMERTYCDPANYPKVAASGEEIAWGYLGTEQRMARFARLLDEAKAAAQTEQEKARIHLFELGTWAYMVAGREKYLSRRQAAIPSFTAPRVANAGGDPSAVDWSVAAPLGDTWYERGTADPAPRRLAGRICHDGTYLYLELTDPCDTSKLTASSTVFPCDDWEIFTAAQRDLPYRQFAVGPTGLAVALSHGEVNWRTNVPIEPAPVRVVSDTLAADRWVSRLAIPLAEVIAGGVTTGGKLYMNIIRVASGAISGTGGLGISALVPYTTVHEVDRLAEVRLAE
ncbi:MAG: DUF4838 domain-containing protein [Armatimonadetes bacterium]|nr:DUF4838 domain-containing protein [Armatimonadota bacterium]